jgi:hypothetical protein
MRAQGHGGQVFPHMHKALLLCIRIDKCNCFFDACFLLARFAIGVIDRTKFDVGRRGVIHSIRA